MIKNIICDDQNIFFVCPYFQCHNSIIGFTQQSHPVNSAEMTYVFWALSSTYSCICKNGRHEGMTPAGGFSFIHVTSLFVSEVFAHFYNVGCHGFQWDESRLCHMNLLFISDDPEEILRVKQTCDLCQIWKTHMPISMHQKNYENV